MTIGNQIYIYIYTTQTTINYVRKGYTLNKFHFPLPIPYTYGVSEETVGTSRFCTAPDPINFLILIHFHISHFWLWACEILWIRLLSEHCLSIENCSEFAWHFQSNQKTLWQIMQFFLECFSFSSIQFGESPKVIKDTQVNRQSEKCHLSCTKLSQIYLNNAKSKIEYQ